MYKRQVYKLAGMQEEDICLKTGAQLEIKKILVRNPGTVSYTHLVSINRSAAVELRITLEAFGTEHKNEIIAALEKEGYQPKVDVYKRQEQISPEDKAAENN